ncbi:hypothetical protein EK904_006616, partial [Melospiza melodia maxima]
MPLPGTGCGSFPGLSKCSKRASRKLPPRLTPISLTSCGHWSSKLTMKHIGRHGSLCYPPFCHKMDVLFGYCFTTEAVVCQSLLTGSQTMSEFHGISWPQV